MVFYLQQIWLVQNITQKLAPVLYEGNIFYRIFEQTTVGKTSFSVSPAVSRQSFETFYRYILRITFLMAHALKAT
jgi:hypothetical protein